MLKSPPPRTRRHAPDTSIRVRAIAHERLKQVGHENRIDLVETIDVLLDAWDALSAEEQRQAIVRRTPRDERGAGAGAGGRALHS